MQEFITTRQVAEMAGVTPITVRRWVAAGIGPAHRRLPSGTLRFHPADVEKWVKSLDRQAIKGEGR
jgi:excisionase family DNA binding protein